MIPRIQIPDQPAPRTIAVCGGVVALVCLDLAYSALTYGWKAEECSAPGVLFCYGMNLLHALGGNALIAASWLAAAALIVRGTIHAVIDATRKERAKLRVKSANSLRGAA